MLLVCNFAILECIRIRREQTVEHVRKKIYMNPIEHIHTGHEFIEDRENTNADTRKRVRRSSQECPSVVRPS